MKRVLVWSGGVLLALVVGVAVLFGPRLVTMVGVGTGYVAKQMCSCLYVAERDFDACRADIPDSMDDIDAQRLDDRPGVRAQTLGLKRLAVHTPGSGCHLLP